MDLFKTLEKRFGHWAIPHLTIYLLVLQAIGVVLIKGDYVDPRDLVLVGAMVEVGEWTRLFSFMMIPKTLNLVWIFFSFYIFYMMGSALERDWGTFKYNLFILTGYLLTIIMAFIAPMAVITNFYFLGTVFLAFATLFPDIEFRLFFILPVKVKWLGWLTVGIYVLTLFSADIGSRLCVVAAFLTYFIFFGKAFIQNRKAGNRRAAYHQASVKQAEQPRHICDECGASDQSDPALAFRYCSTCGKCFCENHLKTHKH